MEPATSTEPDAEIAFRAEVASRFGLVPNFFQTAGEAPGLVNELWGFAKSAYLDNPLPSVFKERLFVHLSRFCSVRYCIVRHVGFLVGAGNPAGDPKATPESVEQVVELLRKPGAPDAAEIAASLVRLSGLPAPMEMPAPGSESEWDVFTAASILFLHPGQSETARTALRAALGGTKLELLTAYLAFIRTAHYWTETHPDLAIEQDMELLMRQHEELAQLMLDPADGERSQIGARLFRELEMLRAERDDSAALRDALAQNEEARRHQQLMINELNHRVKNTLAIIQSVAMQTLRGADMPAQVGEAFVARLLAMADAHDILTTESWESADIGDIFSRAVAAHRVDGRSDRISLEGPPVRIIPKFAVAIAMATHELATNAVKYGALSSDSGTVSIRWGLTGPSEAPEIWVTWTERGGPVVELPKRRGFGSRLIERGLAGELNGSARLDYNSDGVVCAIQAPLPPIDQPV